MADAAARREELVEFWHELWNLVLSLLGGGGGGKSSGCSITVNVVVTYDRYGHPVVKATTEVAS